VKRVTIDPITRLEGHGKIEIFLDETGNVANAYLQVPELRGFERFCMGRPAEELPRIVPRICGVCPGAHHMASAKCVDDLYHVEPPVSARKLRELFYCAHIMHSHIAHFYLLAAPDFVMGPTADPAERNVLGMIGKVGLDVVKDVMKHRGFAQDIQAMIGGKATHPVCALPGGMSKPLNEEERRDIEQKAVSCLEFAQFSLKLFHDVVLGEKEYVDLINSDAYSLKTYYMGMVDEDNRLAFYDGDVRVIRPDGEEFVKFDGRDYLEHIEERTEPWTYLKFPYLKAVGWDGFVDGPDSGVYRVAPLARLNVADGMATPLAQQEYERLFDTLGGKPVHATLANHWARLVEVLHVSERLVELSRDPQITSEDIRTIPTETPTVGVGVVEAPRGTLFHHYETDEEGLVTDVNLIVATGNNHAAICMSVRDAARGAITHGNVSEGLLNMVEMAFRAYDPCIACATHSLPGRMPLTATVYDWRGNLVREITRERQN
jgi:F420-non-reducing hydrogenase large subunit